MRKVEPKMAFFRTTIGFCHRQKSEPVNEKTAWEVRKQLSSP
jgi:hypothetical protein